MFSEGLIIGRNFAFQNGLGLTIKQKKTKEKTLKHYENGLKQLALTVHGLLFGSLLSEVFLRLRFGGLIFGRSYFWGSLLSELYGIIIAADA